MLRRMSFAAWKKRNTLTASFQIIKIINHLYAGRRHAGGSRFYDVVLLRPGRDYGHGNLSGKTSHFQIQVDFKFVLTSPMTRRATSADSAFSSLVHSLNLISAVTIIAINCNVWSHWTVTWARLDMGSTPSWRWMWLVHRSLLPLLPPLPPWRRRRCWWGSLWRWRQSGGQGDRSPRGRKKTSPWIPMSKIKKY